MKRNGKRHVGWIAVGGLSLVLLMTAGCGENGDEQMARPPAKVGIVEAKTGSVTLTRELPGRTSPYVVAEVRPQVTGIVEERSFREGSLVEVGEVLYILDDATYRAEKNRAAASVARAEATVELARINARRTRELTEASAVSLQELDNAEAALHQSEADLEVAKAALESSEVMLGYTQITAPVSGRIGKSAITQGALVTANQPIPLATIQQLDPIYVDLTQSSREMLQLRREIANGNLSEAEAIPVTLYLEDGVEYDHRGQVAFSEATVDPGTGSFFLRVVVPNPDHILLPGMYLRAKVSVGIRKEAILIPQRAVQRTPKGDSMVYLVRDDQTVEQRSVLVGQSLENQYVITHGLLKGDRIIVEGLQKIRPGAVVEIERTVSSEAGSDK